jgi:hypothetical protein
VRCACVWAHFLPLCVSHRPYVSTPPSPSSRSSVNDAKLKELDDAIAAAKEHHGDVEVAEAISNKAAYFASIGDKERAIATYAEVPEKALSTGQKIDAAMAVVRLGFFLGDKRCAPQQHSRDGGWKWGGKGWRGDGGEGGAFAACLAASVPAFITKHSHSHSPTQPITRSSLPIHSLPSLVRTRLAVAKSLNEKGGDWDRRNRLKVYEGLLLASERDFAGAATLLVDSIATFTATELIT